MNKTMYLSTPVLPWDRSAEEERLFRKLAAIFGVIFLVLCLVFAFYPVPEKKREQAERIPPRLAKLVMEKQKPPPPPPPPKEEPKKEEPKPEEVKKEEPKKEEKKKEEPKPVKTAKEKAKAHMAVFDDLADLRDTQDLSQLKVEQQVSAASVGAQAARTERALIGTSAIGGSGGVAVSKASSGGGGSGSLANVSSTKVESTIVSPAAQQAEKRGPGGKARRTTEDVQLVFDRNKGAIYSLYRRALRENPALEGTLVLRMEIQPNGTVSKCEVVSSELKDADLERKIVLKIKQINFGKMDVDVWRDTYPISFIPS